MWWQTAVYAQITMIVIIKFSRLCTLHFCYSLLRWLCCPVSPRRQYCLKLLIFPLQLFSSFPSQDLKMKNGEIWDLASWIYIVFDRCSIILREEMLWAAIRKHSHTIGAIYLWQLRNRRLYLQFHNLKSIDLRPHTNTYVWRQKDVKSLTLIKCAHAYVQAAIGVIVWKYTKKQFRWFSINLKQWTEHASLVIPSADYSLDCHFVYISYII